MSELDYDYKKYTILYVDDELQTLKYFDRPLRDIFTIATASSAAEAWDYALNHPDEIGVVMSDQRMPGESGVDLLGRFRAEQPNVVRILATAYSGLEAAKQAVNEGGAFRYVEKPWDDAELRGILMRAMEFHLLMRDRDRLLREKLSVLQRMFVFDRVRSMAAVAASLEGRVSSPLAAYMSYVEQSPLEDRIAAEIEALESTDLRTLIRKECVNLVDSTSAVSQRLAGNTPPDGASSPFDIEELLRGLVENLAASPDDEGVSFNIQIEGALPQLTGNAAALQEMLTILIRRIGDMDGDDRIINIHAAAVDAGVRIRLVSDGDSWSNGQVSSLYSAIMPVKRGQIGDDMDVLAAFFLASNLGGEIQVAPEQPRGPGFEITLPQQPATAARRPDEKWFDRIFAVLEKWRDPPQH